MGCDTSSFEKGIQTYTSIDERYDHSTQTMKSIPPLPCIHTTYQVLLHINNSNKRKCKAQNFTKTIAAILYVVMLH